MRSLLIATAVCAAVVSLTGCTFTVSGPNNSFTHQARIKARDTCETAEVSEAPGATEEAADCDPSAKQRKVGLLSNMFPCKSEACAEDACAEEACADGLLAGNGIAIPRVGKNLMDKIGSIDLKKSEACAEEACAEEACADGLLAGNGIAIPRVGKNLMDKIGSIDLKKSEACAEEACEDACDARCSEGLLGRMNGISMPSGRLAGIMQGQGVLSQHVPIVDAAGADCCGHFGCGRDGKRCVSCRAKMSFGNGMGLGNGMGVGDGFGVGSGNGLGLRSQMGRWNGLNCQPNADQLLPQHLYPYYTTRGPRDFLMANPPTIGY